MIQFYTAIGRYALREADGKKIPVVVLREGREYALDDQEQIVWFSLLWQIHTLDELRTVYRKWMQQTHTCGESLLDDCLDRMEAKGLITHGRDYVGIDAVYQLLSPLLIIPAPESLYGQWNAFRHLRSKGVPLSDAKQVFQRVTKAEKRVLHLVQNQVLSTSEVIQCVEKGIHTVKTEEDILNALYSDEITTSDNIGIVSRFSTEQLPVLQAVVNLYLKKQILFEKVTGDAHGHY